jgi:hypothetical protein
VARHGTATNTAREIGQSGPCPTLARSDTSPRRATHETLVLAIVARTLLNLSGIGLGLGYRF